MKSVLLLTAVLQLLTWTVYASNDTKLELPPESRDYKLTSPSEDKDALHGLYAMTRGFVNTVAPEDKFLDTIIRYLNGTDKFEVPDDVFTILKLEAGFMACFVAGIILFFGLGIGGVFFCCCRCCCGNCGGKRTQRQKDDLNAKRKTYSCLLFVTVLMMSIALAFAFLVSASLRKAIPKTEDSLLNAMDDVVIFFNTTYTQLQYVGDEGLDRAAVTIINRTKEFDTEVAMPFQSIWESGLNNTLKPNATDADKKIKEMETKVGEFTDLQDGVKELKADLKKIQDDVAEAKKNCQGTNCDKINATAVQENNELDFSDSKLDKFPVVDILKEISEIEKENIREKVNKDAKPDLDSVKDKVEEFRATFKNSSYQNELKKIQDFSADIEREKKPIQDVFKNINEYNDYTYYAMSGLAGLLTIPTALLLLGMLCGMCGHRRARHPAHRSCLSNCGGITVITGVYLLFFLSGIPVLVTMITFVVGGHVESYPCEFMYESDMVSFDKVFRYYQTNMDANSYLAKMKPSQTLNDCKNSSGIYKAFKLEEVINIEKDLDFEKNIDSLRNMNVSIRDKMDFTPATSQFTKLTDFMASKNTAELLKKLKGGDFISVNSVKTWQESLAQLKLPVLEKPIEEIKKFEGKLSKLLDRATNFSTYLEDLALQVTGLVSSFNTSIENCATVIEKEAMEVVENYLSGTLSVGKEIIEMVENDVGKCRQLWVIYDVSRHAVCRDLLNPFNGYWFSLGWFLFFSIFAIAFGSKLSRHYLRMSDTTGTCLSTEESESDTIAALRREIIMKDSPHRSQYMNHGYHEDPPPSYSYGPPPQGYQVGGYYDNKQEQSYGSSKAHSRRGDDDRIEGFTRY